MLAGIITYILFPLQLACAFAVVYGSMPVLSLYLKTIIPRFLDNGDRVSKLVKR